MGLVFNIDHVLIGENDSATYGFQAYTSAYTFCTKASYLLIIMYTYLMLD